jgi:hypothetical protein
VAEITTSSYSIYCPDSLFVDNVNGAGQILLLLSWFELLRGQIKCQRSRNGVAGGEETLPICASIFFGVSFNHRRNLHFIVWLFDT